MTFAVSDGLAFGFAQPEFLIRPTEVPDLTASFSNLTASLSDLTASLSDLTASLSDLAASLLNLIAQQLAEKRVVDLLDTFPQKQYWKYLALQGRIASFRPTRAVFGAILCRIHLSAGFI